MNSQNFFTKISSDIQDRFKMLPLEANSYRQHILDTYFSTFTGSLKVLKSIYPNWRKRNAFFSSNAIALLREQYATGTVEVKIVF